MAHPAEIWWPLAHLRNKPGLSPAYFLPPVVQHWARELLVALCLALLLLRCYGGIIPLPFLLRLGNNLI